MGDFMKYKTRKDYEREEAIEGLIFMGGLLLFLVFWCFCLLR